MKTGETMNKTEHFLGTIEQVVNSYKEDDPVPVDECDYILSLRFSDEEEARINDLLAMNRRGIISQQNLDELDHYLDTGTLLSILKSKARMALKQKTTSA
jgi:hypothetical protein